jgi:hypothetical protein
VRGDIGIATLLPSSNTLNSIPSTTFGGGVLVSGGYSLDIGYRSHLLLQGSFSIRRVNGNNISLSSFGLNWLF